MHNNEICRDETGILKSFDCHLISV